MSDTTYPDGYYLVTWPDEDNAQQPVKLYTNGDRQYIQGHDCFDWSLKHAMEAYGATLTPLVPKQEGLTMDEMAEQIRQATGYVAIESDIKIDMDWGIATARRYTPGRVALSAPTLSDAVRAAWEAVCGGAPKP